MSRINDTPTDLPSNFRNLSLPHHSVTTRSTTLKYDKSHVEPPPPLLFQSPYPQRISFILCSFVCLLRRKEGAPAKPSRPLIGLSENFLFFLFCVIMGPEGDKLMKQYSVNGRIYPSKFNHDWPYQRGRMDFAVGHCPIT